MAGATFEWDQKKEHSNQKKHGVDFAEASTVFGDPLSVTINDPDHGFEEDRYVILGTSDAHRLLVVVHTNRGDRIRLISAREANRYEKRIYQEEKL